MHTCSYNYIQVLSAASMSRLGFEVHNVAMLDCLYFAGQYHCNICYTLLQNPKCIFLTTKTFWSLLVSKFRKALTK